MRVISGRFKGRRLVDFKADHVRPTTDRMKETIFNILMHDIDGARVLDLFSGTGNLAIEACSRGATYIECVDNHKNSIRIIRENLKLLDIQKEIRVVPLDVFKYLKTYKGEPFQLVFADPPYTEKIAHDCMLALQSSRIFMNGTKVIIESSRHDRVDNQYGPLHLLDQRDFGDKSASIFQARL
jgi:16S rRNA (guanine966-N2)-methyltransferase